MALQFINHKGEFVENGAEDAAYQVNISDEKGSSEFIDAIKNQYRRSSLPLASAVTSALEVAPETENPTTFGAIKPAILKKLQEAGFDSADKLAGATDDELKAAGASDKDVSEIRKATTPTRTT